MKISKNKNLLIVDLYFGQEGLIDTSTLKGEQAINKYLKLSKKLKIDAVSLAHTFVISRPFVTSSIMGVSNLDQLKKNINSINLIINEKILYEINKIHNEDRKLVLSI